MKKSLIVSTTLVVFLLSSYVSYSCSIFCSNRNGEILAAGNEDWSDPFSKFWVSPRTNDSYGTINIGHSDGQRQLSINEFGLFYDFAAIPQAEGKNLNGKQDFNGSLFTEILAKCKTIDETLVYLKKLKYQSPFHQVLMADASGRSIVVNQDIIIEDSSDYRIATNFNACDISGGNYDCRRFQIIDEALSAGDKISIALFRNLLSRTHQEGPYPTQYSYIIDQKRGELHIYSFHNYENELVINIKEEISKGYSMKELKELFPIAFEEEYFRSHHIDSLKETLLKIVRRDGAEQAIKKYMSLSDAKSEIAPDPQVLWDVAASIIQDVWMQETSGATFEYWWHANNYVNWTSKNPDLQLAMKIVEFMERVPKENPKQNIGVYELKGLLLSVNERKMESKQYFEKTMSLDEEHTGNYHRAKVFVEYLK
ncbi:MAG: hypothetical protein RH948_03965 [Cyclobacteriaceae bacterium]